MSDEHRPDGPAPRQSLLVPVAIIVGLLAGIGLVLWTFSRVLLQVEPRVATATALLVATAIVAIVSYAASRKRVTNGSLLTVVVGVVGVAMLFSGVALTVGQGGEETGPTAVTIALAAPKGAAVSGYDLNALSAPADTPTIAFNNQDPAVQHNVAIASADPAKDPAAETLFDGDLVTGPQEFDYAVQPLPEGEYHFFCKVHPSTMKGTLTVSPGAAPGASGGSTITAANVAFDTDVLEFPPNAPSTLTFQNDDAGTTHNVAIYTDESASEALFQGEIITGVDSIEYAIPAIPAGTYFFRCDVHPNMNGTVNVGPGGGQGGGAPSPQPSGGGTSAAPPPTSGAPPPGAGVTLVAQNLAFDPTELSLPAGQPGTITFDNEDAGTPHNLSIWTDDTYSGDPLFTGDVVTGVASADYAVPALEPGTYAFRCDIHTTMTGTITVG